ncbi:MAG TPA: MFS transporter [Bryobacteraceae bacterium]|nr:MFS transporter [Bryobacteraceae bacterium]
MTPPAALPAQVGQGVVHVTARRLAKPWQILGGLIVSGFLLALPGGLLPLWGYHIHPDFGTAGDYFLLLGLGMIGGGLIARRLVQTAPLERLLAAGCLLAAASMLMVSVAAPPARVWYQMATLFVVGAGAGIVNTAVLEALTPCYESNPATITLTGGIFFGGGSVLAAFLLAQSFGDLGATRLLVLAALASVLLGFLMSRLQIERREVTEVPLAQSMQDLRSPLAVIFSLLLFFQFANEWSLAGWLPVFLIDRMGLSPGTAIMLLAYYWLALTVGRIVVSKLLRSVRHGRLMAFSAFCALFGCTAMLAAGSRFGVVAGLLLTGAGFSAIYPLVAERIANRFSYYHPGYFNGIFTFALMGGILTPFVLGHIAASAGLNVIPLAVMFGSCGVFILVFLIWLGHTVSGR